MMENCGKTHPILVGSNRTMQLPLGSFFILGESRIQSMVPINGAFCHSTDLLPSGYTTRQSPSGWSESTTSLLYWLYSGVYIYLEFTFPEIIFFVGGIGMF